MARNHPSLRDHDSWKPDFGADCLDDGSTRFRVWAPAAASVAVVKEGSRRAPAPLAPEVNGYFSAVVPRFRAGERYRYLLDGVLKRPDPASRFQPQGVHGPSEVVAPERYRWQDGEWRGIPLERFIIYELHVGAFSEDGSFDGVVSRLDYLCELGVSAVELMPVAQFPGRRNWGYDGTFPFAPHDSYGGPEGLKRLVDACHARGLAVILDVVYNHLGPEGNYLHAFGPYFTDRYRTPWGDAVNFDGPDSDAVRHYFVANALYWVAEYHVDALRLDAVHGIYDASARHILEEIAHAVHQMAARLGRLVYLIAESDLNDVRVIRPPQAGGYGVDAQWNDDFHHALRALLTGDRSGYHADFGSFSHLVKAFREGFVLSGGYSVYRRRCHGTSCADRPLSQLVVFAQNHDQVGNRRLGDRLHEEIDPPRLRLAAAAVLLSPYLPLLFMGEEYAEPAPFPYFVHHGDPELISSVRTGRQQEFAAWGWQGEVPDPQAESTALSARLSPALHRAGEHARLFSFYRELIRLRRELPPLSAPDRAQLEVGADESRQLLTLLRREGADQVLCLFNFSARRRSVRLPGPPGGWRPVLDSTTPDGLPGRRGDAPGGETARLAPFAVKVFRRN